MKIVIAPDSFKECLPAIDVGESIKKGILAQIPNAKIDVLPMADGGEGTIDALLYGTNGQTVELEATDPYGDMIKTNYGILGDSKTIVIEMANIAGLQVVSKRDPRTASTYGVGELINHAVKNGYRKFIVGLGGSATNDGGIGMLQALGGKFLDENGKQVPLGGGYLSEITNVDLSDIDPAIYVCEIIIASDVENKLCGQNGATYVYGHQKGVKEDELDEFDRSLLNVARLIEKELGRSLQNVPGAGAAGGLGFGLLVLGATIESGAKIVSEAMKLETYIQSADWVITGEGKSDFQTAYGKVPVHVAKIANKHSVKSLLLTGALGKDYQQLYDYFISCHSIANGPMSLEQSIKQAEQLLYEASMNIARLVRLIKN